MSLTWEVFTGADGVHYAHQGRYTARIVEGRVTRWQAGDDNEPARLSGRTTRGMGEAREMCALAARLLALSDAGADVEGLPAGEAVTRAMVDDLKDQIGERDGVIAQLRATLKRYTDVYGDPADSDRLTAEYAASFASGLREEMARIERDGALVSKVADMLREAGVAPPDLPDDYDVTALVARLKARAPREVKVGDRVMWCDRTLTGVVVCQWMGKVSGEMQCRVRSDDGQEWDATINGLEVVK